MSCDVFISYKSEERQRAQQVRATLALALGCSIWWDQDLQTGGKWSQEIDRAIREAGCVVVLWSDLACRSPWVQQEAAVAKAMNKLVPASIDNCQIPGPYTGLQTAKLNNWQGSEHDPEFRKMVNAVTQILGQRATSVASTEKEFLRAGLRRWFYSGVGLLVVAAMSWYWLRATEIACRRDVTARWTIDWNYENCKADPSGCGDSPQHQKWVMGLQQSGCLVTGELHLEAEGDKRSRTDALFGAVNQSKVLFSIDVGAEVRPSCQRALDRLVRQLWSRGALI